MAAFQIAAVLVAVISSSAGYEFGPVCCSNPTNIIRGSDDFGSGEFGASRDGSSRTHKGVDIECTDGSKVYAPLDMTITGSSSPYQYGTKTDINNGVAFEAEGMSFKMWYISPVKTSGSLKKGELLGTMLPMQSVYKGMTSHVHIQKEDETDPTDVVNTQNEQANTDFCSGK